MRDGRKCSKCKCTAGPSLVVVVCVPSATSRPTLLAFSLADRPSTFWPLFQKRSSLCGFERTFIPFLNASQRAGCGVWMGFTAALALGAEGKDAETLTRHFKGLQERATVERATGSAAQSEDSSDYSAYAFWRTPVQEVMPTMAEPQCTVEVRFVGGDQVEASDLARLLFVDDDFREHLQTKLAVGMSTLLLSPVGRLWHVRSELTKQLLHSFTATPGLSAVEVRGPSLPKADPPPSLKVRLADFEASFRAKHGRAITPADGPSLPKEVLAMYREYAESLRMTPEQTKEAVAKLEARETARAAAKVRAEAAAVERARRRTEWEAGKEGAWAAAKSEARDRRSELVADERCHPRPAADPSPALA